MSRDPATRRSRRPAPRHRIRMSLAAAAHDVAAAATAPAAAGPPPQPPPGRALKNAQILCGEELATEAWPCHVAGSERRANDGDGYFSSPCPREERDAHHDEHRAQHALAAVRLV